MKRVINNIKVVYSLILWAVSYTPIFAQSLQYNIDPKTVEASTCKAEGLPMGKYSLYNNQWGKYKVKKGKVEICMYHFKPNQNFQFGWTFQMPHKAYGVVAYPEVFWGKSIWETSPAPYEAPFQLKKIQNFEIIYDAELKVSQDKYNLATDIWISSELHPHQKSIYAEIMVWEKQNNFKPNGKKKAVIATSQGQYILRVGKIYRKELGLHWLYFAFVRKEGRTQGTLPMKELLDYLLKNNYLNAQHYLTSIEMGTELSNADGTIFFRHYEVKIN